MLGAAIHEDDALGASAIALAARCLVRCGADIGVDVPRALLLLVYGLKSAMLAFLESFLNGSEITAAAGGSDDISES